MGTPLLMLLVYGPYAGLLALTFLAREGALAFSMAVLACLYWTGLGLAWLFTALVGRSLVTGGSSMVAAAFHFAVGMVLILVVLCINGWLRHTLFDAGDRRHRYLPPIH
jgi:hypothetical protein